MACFSQEVGQDPKVTMWLHHSLSESSVSNKKRRKKRQREDIWTPSNFSWGMTHVTSAYVSLAKLITWLFLDVGLGNGALLATYHCMQGRASFWEDGCLCHCSQTLVWPLLINFCPEMHFHFESKDKIPMSRNHL